MPERPFLSCVAALALLLCAYPASAAQLYKWVDERGITNYSDQAPAKAASKQLVGEGRVSVYTPDPLLVQAVQAERARAIHDLRTGRRARELQEDWLARQYFASAHAYAADPCAGDPRCGAYAPNAYLPMGGFLVSRRGPRILPQIDLPPGTTAGNVNANTGYIPGYSAFARGATTTAPRRVLEAARANGGDGGRAGGSYGARAGGHRR